ncbi:MAG: hypothetical protein SH850_02915 [Planctomycetaceae bacterium]|nr:hypothetical protein [Planctomycetaceae bacterium]
MRFVHSLVGYSSLAAMLVAFSGCMQTAAPTQVGRTDASRGESSDSTPTKPDEAEGDHAHRPGAHGGIIVSIGLDSYHAEAIVEKSGTLRLLMLGKDESRIQDVERQTLTAYVKVAGDADAEPIELAPAPQEGDGPEQTSQFVGQLPGALAGRQVEVTIPMLRIAGARFRVGFSTAAPAHVEDMPAALPALEEQALYLTPGGVYTSADIVANGSVTAGQKFRGVMASHDMKPKVGDRICPITNTKSNAKFTWVVGGKPYEFCCPPCVDEFVKLAKEQPDAIKNPETYIR